MNTCFDCVKTNFGFGMMRLPMIGDEIDFAQCNEMVDHFMAAGLTYFDTAHGYLDGKSEIALRECVVKRYPRERFTITNKLSGNFFKTEAEIYDVFQQQLDACGVDYFDFYLMHSQGKSNYGHFQACRAYEVAQELKKQGKVRHVGLSFHDTAEFLEQILTDHPEVELVQLQINYVDYEDAGVQGRRCLEVCKKHNKPVVVMEPVKGGILVNLPPEADQILRELKGGSNASYAIRFAASCPQVFMVLSGMSTIQQMEDNVSHMAHFVPLNEKEREAIEQVCQIFKKENLIACTGCRYCVDGCPKHILIPDVFADLNEVNRYQNWGAGFYYNDVHTLHNGKASDCIKCGQCEKICPQHLPIRQLLEKVAATFEKKK